ncbi:hypothetical protein GCM10027521_12700 [Amycolatopsis cihanbeyliensis]
MHGRGDRGVQRVRAGVPGVRHTEQHHQQARAHGKRPRAEIGHAATLRQLAGNSLARFRTGR